MAKRRKRAGKQRGACKTVTFKRASRTGRVRGRASWVTVKRCEGRKLSTGAKRRWAKMRGKKVCRAKVTGRFRKCR